MREGRIGRLSWRKLEPFGAEVEFDFRKPLVPTERSGFRSLLFTHRLLVAHDQSLSLAQQQDVAAYIGPVLRGPRGLARISPDDGMLNEARLAYHSDLAFAPEPFTALSLHAVEVAQDQTSTLFVDGVLACRNLPAATRARIGDCEAIFVQPLRPDTRQIEVQGSHAPVQRSWRVLTPHPVTGDIILFVNESHVDRVVGLEPAGSRHLLTELFDHLYSPPHTFEHVWRNGDLLLWDNMALQHARPDVTGIRPRLLQRASVADRSLAEQIPQFFAGRATPGSSGAVRY